MSRTSTAAGKPVLAVFDVCDTLYAANTTLALLEKLARTERRVARALNRWTSRRSPLFYLGAISHRFLNRDLARSRLIASLRGIPRSDLEAAGRDVAGHELPELANPALHDRLRRHREAGHRVVLLTNSLDIVVGPIADSLGVPYQASELDFRNGLCTGRLNRDLTGRKAMALAEIGNASEFELWVYTDNRTDSDILALADVATIVLPRGRSSREWGGKGSEYIRL